MPFRNTINAPKLDSRRARFVVRHAACPTQISQYEKSAVARVLGKRRQSVFGSIQSRNRTLTNGAAGSPTIYPVPTPSELCSGWDWPPPMSCARTAGRAIAASGAPRSPLKIDDRNGLQNDNLIGERQRISRIHTLWATTAWQPGAERSEVWDELLLSASG
jgi:hypothetical protein